MPRRLLIISRSHNPLGGADRIIADLCRELPRRGWQVTLGLTLGARFNRIEPYREVHGDLPIVEIDGCLGTRRARLRALGQTITAHRPQVVLSMRVFDVYEAVALAKAAGGDMRLAVGIRAFEFPYLDDLIRYRDSVDLCVTSGELIAAACREQCGMDAARVSSIGGGVHPPITPVAPRRRTEHLSLLYAGRLETNQKRVLDLVPFVRELQHRDVAFHLDVVGTGPAEAVLRTQLEPFLRSGVVRLHGWVSRDELYQTFYPRADCFVHFAAWEGVTIAPREAMANGVVPVISQFQGLTMEGQFTDRLTALTFPVGDTAAAVSCVQRLRDEPELLSRLSENGLDSQRGKYTFEGSMDAWTEALNGCLAMPVQRGPIPCIREHLDGRLSRWGVPVGIQSRLRECLRLPISHASPGSEWPTASGLLTEAARGRFEEFAKYAEAKHQDVGLPPHESR